MFMFGVDNDENEPEEWSESDTDSLDFDEDEFPAPACNQQFSHMANTPKREGSHKQTKGKGTVQGPPTNGVHDQICRTDRRDQRR